MFLQVLGDGSIVHPRRDDRRYIIVVEHAFELEDIRARHVFPDDRLLAKTLPPTKSASVRVQFLPTHPLELCPALLVRSPQDLHRNNFAVALSPEDLGACSGCIGLVGESHCALTHPVRKGEVLTPARKSRECRERL